MSCEPARNGYTPPIVAPCPARVTMTSGRDRELFTAIRDLSCARDMFRRPRSSLAREQAPDMMRTHIRMPRGDGLPTTDHRPLPSRTCGVC
jgi:hypothetical protein